MQPPNLETHETPLHDHPLRADPLHSLPDAITIPRRPRPHSPPSHSPLRTPSLTTPSRTPPSPIQTNLKSNFATTSFDARLLASEALNRFQGHLPDDPLLSAVVHNANPLPSPPAGHAFATDIDAIFSTPELPTADPHVSPPVAAGNVHRADVTLIPTDPQEGGPAGVYIVRSRRNWGLVESSSYTTLVPSSPSSVPSLSSPSHDYYTVRRSLADFSWLHNRLLAKYDGIIVPSLPPMAFAGRISHGFAHDIQRCRGLQRFLRRVATHPVLATGDEALSFLGASGDDTWQKIRRELIVKDSSVTDLLFGAIREERSNGPLQRVGMWGEKLLWQTGKKFNQGLVWFLDRDRGSDNHKEDDSAKARFERLQTYVRQLSITLSSLRVAASRVAKTRGQESDGLAALQNALQTLAQGEGGKFGAHLQRISIHTTNTTAGVYPGGINEVKSPNTTDDAHFDDSDHNYVDVINGGGAAAAAVVLNEVLGDFEERTKGALRIMAARQEEQEAYERALVTYKKLRDKLESQTGSMWEAAPKGLAKQDGAVSSHVEGEDEFNELIRQVNVASSRLSDVRKHYQAVAMRTTGELRRLRKELHDNLCEALECLAKELVREHMAQVRAWAHLAEMVGEYREMNH